VYTKESKYEQQAEKIFRKASDLLFQKKEKDKGRALLSKIIEKFAESPWAGYAQSSIALSQRWEGKLKEAEESYKKALLLFKNVVNKFPNTERAANAMFGLALCYGDLNEEQKKIQTFEQIISSYPESLWAIGAWGHLAHHYKLKKDFEKAEKTCAKLISIYKELIAKSTKDKEVNQARFALAQVYELQESWDKALALYQEMIKASKDSSARAGAHFRKASLYKRLGEPEKTKKEYEQIIDKYRRSQYVKYAYSMLGDVYYETGNYAAAIKVYNKYLKRFPKSSQAETVKARTEGAKKLISLQKGLAANLSLELTLKPKGSFPEKTLRELLSQISQVISKRLNEYGAKDFEIKREDKTLSVFVKGISNPERIKDLITRKGLLEFSLVIETDKTELQSLKTGGIPENQEIKYDLRGNPYLVNKKTIFRIKSIEKANVDFDEFKNPCIYLQLNMEEGQKFGEFTARNINKRLAIIIDGKVYSAPEVKTRITSRFNITGRFSLNDAYDFAAILKGGTLPTPIEIVSE
jgi:tetratricopeptide (TPR) repeat protein